MKRIISAGLPWQGLIDSCRKMETPWRDGAADVMQCLMHLNLEEEDLGEGDIIPEETLKKVHEAFMDIFTRTERLEYQLKVFIRFNILRSIVGVFLRSISCCNGNESDEAGRVLARLTQAVIVSSITLEPFTLKVWKGLIPYLEPELQGIFDHIMNNTELVVMRLAGNTVYHFFNTQQTIPEIDDLLAQCHQALAAAEKRRKYTCKRGQGHTKLIIDHILLWQEKGYMRHIDTAMPFIRCLEAHWNHEFKLGSRQGVERMYRKKHC